MAVVMGNFLEANWLRKAVPLSPLAGHLLCGDPLCCMLTPVAVGPLRLVQVAVLRRSRVFSWVWGYKDE